MDFEFSFTTQVAPCAPLWGIECRIAGPLNALPFSPGMLCAGNSVGQEILTCTSVFTICDCVLRVGIPYYDRWLAQVRFAPGAGRRAGEADLAASGEHRAAARAGLRPAWA